VASLDLCLYGSPHIHGVFQRIAIAASVDSGDHPPSFAPSQPGRFRIYTRLTRMQKERDEKPANLLGHSSCCCGRGMVEFVLLRAVAYSTTSRTNGCHRGFTSCLSSGNLPRNRRPSLDQHCDSWHDDFDPTRGLSRFLRRLQRAVANTLYSPHKMGLSPSAARGSGPCFRSTSIGHGNTNSPKNGPDPGGL